MCHTSSVDIILAAWHIRVATMAVNSGPGFSYQNVTQGVVSSPQIHSLLPTRSR